MSTDQNANQTYTIDTAENRRFLADNAQALLAFGHRFPSPGGSSYYLGDDGTPWKECNRETWITSRMAHVYSIGTMLGHAGSGELADAAIKGLRGELKDKEHGGWYAGLTADGAVVPGKQCYAHAFVILAATSALLAGRDGAKELLDGALALYDAKFWNEAEGLSCDTWDTQFRELDDYRGLNANMHTVEAFLAVADAIGDETYRRRAGRIIDRVTGWAQANHDRIPEHFSPAWEPMNFAMSFLLPPHCVRKASRSRSIRNRPSLRNSLTTPSVSPSRSFPSTAVTRQRPVPFRSKTSPQETRNPSPRPTSRE